MGLDTSHDCWGGSYSTFNEWRRELARAAGLPPLDFMEGFCEAKSNGKRRTDRLLPISWHALTPTPLLWLLNHSDSDGRLPWRQCNDIADSLEEILSDVSGPEKPQRGRSHYDMTIRFIRGLRVAGNNREDVVFS